MGHPINRDIYEAIVAHFAPKVLAHRRVLITAGPTFEPLDPVRGLTNRSSGKMGFALARAAQQAGADVHLVAGPVALDTPWGVYRQDVQTAQQMYDAVMHAVADADIFIAVAAVADWRVASASDRKIKKRGDGSLPVLEFAENPDILARVAAMGAGRPRLVVGFAAETDDVQANAAAKRARKGCDWILANDVSPATGIMGGSENAVTLITESGAEDWPRMTKTQVAARLAARIAEALAGAGAGAAGAAGAAR